MPAVSVFDKQAVQVERVRMGQLGSLTLRIGVWSYEIAMTTWLYLRTGWVLV